MSILLVRHLIFKDVCKFHSVVNMDCDFSLIINAVYVHYNFQSEKRDYELSISLVRHLIFRDVCKLQSVVNLDYDFSLVINVVDVHYNF